MTLSRRHVLHGAAACALPLALSQRSAFASKAEFRYKYANNLPATHPMNIRALQMSQAILAETGGQVDIQVFSMGSSARTPMCWASCARAAWSSSRCRA